MYIPPAPDVELNRWLAELIPQQASVAVLGGMLEAFPGHRCAPGYGLDWLIVPDQLAYSHQPESELLTWRNWLAPMGRLVLRIPNLRHFPNLLTLLRGHWPEPDSSPLVHPLTAESVLALFEATGWEPLEVRAFQQEWPQQAEVRAALAYLSANLEGFDADSTIAHFYILATPRASADHPLPLPLEGLRARNVLLPLMSDQRIRLQEYLTSVPVEADLAAILMPLDLSVKNLPEDLLRWLEAQGFDATHIPDLIVPELPLGLEQSPALLQTVSALVADEHTPLPLLEACRRQHKHLIWRADGPPPPGFRAQQLFMNWQDWLQSR